ncbi:hypothetical protein [Patiriisocius marinus]|uniref:Uncharacterized protein n=1 Tax=Patiriisocius marinus TaxID=1397112 RepID=A0A5J4IX98_9FLAO|nr:hypothetical protein [Patiriisocius marinus]GER58198.1 hypothetical protein ULMA_03060 [Patiriisocius marinus]
MRNLIKLFIGLFVFSCQPFPETSMTKKIFSVKNVSPENVKLVIFLFADEEPELINLMPLEVFVGDVIETTGPLPNEIPNESTAASSLNASEIIILFNEEKMLTSSFSEEDVGFGFFSEPILRNLLRNGNYVSIGNNEFQFEITQEDFENTIPCEGPCL